MQAVRDGVQDVAVKVLAASPTEAIQLHALKKVCPCVAMLINDMLRMPGKVNMHWDTNLHRVLLNIQLHALKKVCPCLALLEMLRMPERLNMR